MSGRTYVLLVMMVVVVMVVVMVVVLVMVKCESESVMIRDNIHTVLEEKAREMIESRLAQFSLVDQVSVLLLHL